MVPTPEGNGAKQETESAPPLWEPARGQSVQIKDPNPAQPELQLPIPVSWAEEATKALPLRTGLTPDTLSTKPVPVNLAVHPPKADVQRRRIARRATRREPVKTVSHAMRIGVEVNLLSDIVIDTMTLELEQPRLYTLGITLQGSFGKVTATDKNKTIATSDTKRRTFSGLETPSLSAVKQHGTLSLLYQEHEEEMARLAKARSSEDSFWNVWG